LMGGVFIAMEASAVADAEQPVAVNQPDGVKADQPLVSTYLQNFARILEPFNDFGCSGRHALNRRGRMQMMIRLIVVLAVVLVATVVAAHEKVSIRDDCDPTDPAWAPTGGCALEEGNVNVAEFNALLNSPLSLAVVGHPAWRFDPTYLKIEPDETVRVENEGGRAHTFTEVSDFGGGRVPPLNKGLTPAPECAGAATLLPGAAVNVSGLSEGDHRFQCCIHPWMRALIKVLPQE